GLPVRPDEAQVFEAWCILAAEHALTVSTFAARVVATTGIDPAFAALAGLVALHGPTHGGAFEAIRGMLTAVARGADASEVIARADPPPAGFGHSGYPTGDPRARALRDLMTTLPSPPGLDWVGAADQLARAGEAAGFGPATLDLYAVALLRQLGTPPTLDTVLFAVARMVGWTAHAIEQRADNRMTRPIARYIGPAPRSLPDV
ncbi:MAG: citrate/2-methylcitrate synthase, partial [Dehalococcoidia bacterium]|nr:citrate/2-methylcitrate synthase [Dehalococcoidia bacterium]